MAPSTEIDLEQIERLIFKREHDADFETKTEADIRGEYIDPLFDALGWNTRNLDPESADEWQREHSGVEGRTDYLVSLSERPFLAIEAKRAGRVTSVAERRKKFDRTPEERQVLRYTRERRVPWAILTNFDRLLVFDADGERLLLGFDSPKELLSSLGAEPSRSLRQLSYAAVTGGSLDWLRDLALKHEIDAQFLQLLGDLRLILARDILARHRSNPLLLEADGSFSLESLLRVVQRVLDRMILVRYADDQEILRQHDLLGNLLRRYEALGEYRSPDELHAMLVRLWAAVDRIHDTTIFEQGHPCEHLPLSNEILTATIEALDGVSFRKFTADILGATYESYLGTTLAFTPEGQLSQHEEPEKRRWAGIFYTPSFVVHEIVETTLGARLDDLRARHGLAAIEHVRGLRVLDPACGSGSFLIAAYDRLARFYRELNLEIDAEFDRVTAGSTDPFEQVERAKAVGLPRTVPDYPWIILTEHLYGVDIDSEAAEIATLNLVMRAFTELRLLNRQHERLPLILNQNIKVGNSLVETFATTLTEYAIHRNADIRRMVRNRGELANSRDDERRRALYAEYREIATPIEEIARALGARKIPADVSAFDWYAEFPEVWFTNDGQVRSDAGFDVVIGNPPYIRVQRLRKSFPWEADFYRTRYVSSRRGNYDIYVLFIERGLELLSATGVLGYIVPHRFFVARYGAPLRRLLSEGGNLRRIVNFGAEQVFDAATTYTTLLFLNKAQTSDFSYLRVTDINRWREKPDTREATFPASYLGESPWTFPLGEERQLFERLRGFATLGDVAEAFTGVQTSADDVYIMDYVGDSQDGILLRSRALQCDWIFESAAARPLVSGTHVGRYAPLRTQQWILFPYHVAEERAELIDFADLERQWPRAAKYLLRCRQRLEEREGGEFRDENWHRFGRSQNLGKQGRMKLCVPRLVETLRATIDAEGGFVLDNVDVGGVSMRPTAQGHHLEYFLGLLNSRLLDWVFRRTSAPFRGNWFSANRQYLDTLPVRLIDFGNSDDVERHKQIVSLVRQILEAYRRSDEALLEREREENIELADQRARVVDQLIYDLYGLSDAERALVNGDVVLVSQED